MGKLLDFLQAAAGEGSLRSRLGRWRQEVSNAVDSLSEQVADLIDGVISVEVLQLPAQGSPPAAEPDIGSVFTMNVNGVTELFYVDSSGNVIQITSNGRVVGGPFVSPDMPWVEVVDTFNHWANISPVIMLPGDYIADTSESLDSGVHIVGSPGVTVTSTMPFSGLQLNSIFRAQAVASGKTGTLAAVGVRGSYTLSYTAVTGGAPVAGEVFAVSTGLNEQIFTVQSVAGGAPFVLTLDRPVTVAFANGSPVSFLSERPRIIIEGRGMRATGTGDRVVEIITGYQCHVSGIHYDTLGGAMTDMAFAYDIGGVECVFEDCSADGDGAPATFYGFALEANERSIIKHCTATRPTAIGIALIDCISCGVVDCSVSGNANDASGGAIGVGTAGAPALGSFENYLEGCSTQGCQFGFVITASDDCSITDSSFQYASNAAILFNSTTSISTRFTNVDTRFSARGLNCANVGNRFTKLTNCDFSNCTVYLIDTANDIEVDGLVAIGLSTAMAPAVLCSGGIGVLCRFRNVRYENSASSNVIQSSSASRIEIDGADINLGALSIALYGSAGGGLFVASNVRTSGSAVGTFGANLTATTLRKGVGIDFGSTAVPVALGAGGFSSTGQLVSNGTGAAQAVAWPYVNAQDHVTWTRIANGGAPGLPPLSVVTPGVGFSATFAAGDTSTYEYAVGGN